MIGSRTYGTKAQSRASKRVGAAQYLVCARNPDVETLVGIYDVPAAEAERMIREEQHKRSLSI